MRSQGHLPGQVLVLFALVLPVLLLMVGVAIDGSRLFQAHLAAQILADQAAGAAAQQVDIGSNSTVRSGVAAELIQGRGRESAFAAAEEYLARRATDGRTRWSIVVERRAITVTVERRVELAFMPIAGLREQLVEARSVASPVSGIAVPRT